MKLCRLIYTGNSHFNIVVFDQNGFSWKHDRMNNGGQ
jgi:hypothetical protein